MEKVSAIITTHKRDPSIVKRALLSVTGQTYQNIEIIIVDDSPPDYKMRDSVERMIHDVEKETGRTILYIRHSKCLGACAARNTGLIRSTGSIIGYLDDDDEWMPEKVEVMLKGFSSESIALVYCDFETCSMPEGTVSPKKRGMHTGRVYESLILGNYIGSTSFPLIRRDCLISVGAFDEEMPSSQDYDAWLRLAQRYEINYVERILNRYYVHEGEQITKNIEGKIKGLERLNEKNRTYLSSHAEAFWIRNMIIIPYYMKGHNRRKALKTWLQCAYVCPFKLWDNLKYLFFAIFGKRV